MKLILKLLCVSIISCAPSEAQVERLLGVRDEYLVTTCLGSGARCDGALLRSDWVVVQDSCFKAHKFTPMKYVVLGKHNCSMEAVTPSLNDEGGMLTRSVLKSIQYEELSYMDLVLLKLDRPYELQFYNLSHDSETLNKFSRWFEAYLYMSTINTPPNSYLEPMSYETTMYRMKPIPFKVFLLTVILPIVSFAAFFIYVIFYTGNTDVSKISYTTLNNEKKAHPV
ncbi:hypothetical protein KGM_209358 [Danaus plexippus plexippus]|uniref:Uncharacterized protein n=2 Tax=Danaus plexippus TaxID=13037 RepID=A0A212FF81_DANPL|nr:hypothetical protein KGM_209358 [Danaus plexippus plexippus]